MRNNIYKSLLIVLFFGASFTLFSQNVAINRTGNSPYASAILDLSNQNTVGTVGFLPPYVTLTALTTFGLSGTAAQSNGIIVYNTGGTVPAGLYYWNNPGSTWVAMTGGAAALSGTTNYLARWTSATTLGIGVAQDNGSGVSIASTALTPANMLDVKGSEAIGTYAGTAAPANGMIVSGQVGIGNSAPASSSIIDFTNTKATGGTGAPLLWPMNTNPTVNITSPVLGEEVYNTTTGCFNFYNGTIWETESCPCSAAPGIPTITATCSQSFQGSSITYTSSIVSGVSFSWTATATVGTPTLSANGLSSITVTWPSGGACTGSVVLTLTNLCGTTSASKAVTINANPTVSGSSSLLVASAGNTYACSQAGATYAWSSNSTYGSIIGSATGQTVSVTSANSAGTFTLTCLVSFGACTETLTYPVLVSCPATPTIAGSTTLTEASVGNTYTCSLASATYSWSSNNTTEALIVGSNTTQSISVTAGALAGTFTLTCNVTYAACTYTVTFAGSVVSCSHATITYSYTGAQQTWTVPPCITTITIVASGGAGAACNGNAGGDGAVVTATVTVVSGNTLDIVAGGAGSKTGGGAGGAGGGSFVWDNSSTTYPLVAAGGGGGGGRKTAGNPGSTTKTPTTVAGQNGTGGTNGLAGAEGATSVKGAGGGGTGWKTTTGNPAAATAYLGAGGVGEPSAFAGGAGQTSSPSSNGGYGGGGGGGYNASTFGAGGGGGGFNGGGGGNATTATKSYGGGGGGSGYYNAGYPYVTAADFVNPATVTQTNAGAGSVKITY